MPEPDDPDIDDAVDARLRAVLAITEAPPPHLVEAARASFSWRTADAALAELVSDSAVEPAAAMRAAAPPRLLTFSAAGTTIVLEVGGEPDRRRLMGQVIAPARATIDVRHPAGSMSVSADADGRFRADQVTPGPVSLRCRFEDDRAPVVTSWVAI